MSSDQANCQCKKKTVFFAVVFSLALNFFLVGVIAAPLFFKQKQTEMIGMPHPGPVFDRMAEGLSAADAEKMHAIYANSNAQFEQNFEAMRVTKDKVIALLGAEKFDATQLDAAFDEMYKAGEAIHRDMFAVIRQAAKELSPEGRRQLMMFGPMPPRGGMQGGRRDHPPGFGMMPPPQDDHRMPFPATDRPPVP